MGGVADIGCAYAQPTEVSTSLEQEAFASQDDNNASIHEHTLTVNI
jgi:hypothetical protein